MGLFNKKNDGGLMDMIRCDEPSYLIWKWHPNGSQVNNSNKENSIRWGSSLRVKDGEVAVFVYKQDNGVQQDFIVGPFDDVIHTKNFPILANIVGLAYDGGTPFQAEVYFINLAQIIQVKFAVPFFDVFDPRFYDFSVPVAVRGTINFRIDDYKSFIKLHRLVNFSLDDFQRQIRDAVSRYIKEVVANSPAENNIPVIQLETKISMINDVAEYNVRTRLKEDFGVVVSGMDIASIEVDKSSEGFKQLMAVTKDVSTAKVEAQTTDYTERLRIQREEDQYAIHKKTQSSNFGVFRTEKQADVGIAGADALGKMGANGAGGVDLGGGNMGFNPAAMMAGVALGGAVGQNIAGTMNGTMNGINQPQTQMPPIPVTAYNIVVNGQAYGPYTLDALQQMIPTNQFTKETLVWKEGMSEWTRADSVEELANLFVSTMPPIPSNE